MGSCGLLGVFAAPSFALMIVGGLASMKAPMPEEVAPSQALLFASLSWLMAAGVGGVPFVLAGLLGPVDAFFESMSGFTATGMTLLSGLEGLPRSVLFWRALTQWLGGGGVVLFFVLLVAPRGMGVWRLYVAEAREERLTVRAWDTAKDI